MVDVHRLRIPIECSDIDGIRIGDTVYITGSVVAARDVVYRRFIEEGAPLLLDL